MGYGRKYFNYKLHVTIWILRKNYLEMFWLLQRSLHYPDRQQLVWSSCKDSLKTAKLPIFMNSPGHKYTMTFKFPSILTVCWSSLLQAQSHTALSSQALAKQGCRTTLPPQFTFLTADMKKKSLHSNAWKKKKNDKDIFTSAFSSSFSLRDWKTNTVSYELCRFMQQRSRNTNN